MNVLPMLYLRYGNVEIKKQISDDIKQFSYEICQKHKAVIRYMETDKDHRDAPKIYRKPRIER